LQCTIFTCKVPLIVRPILCYGSETWILTRREKYMLDKFERILQGVYGRKLESDKWRIRYIKDIYYMNRDINVTQFIIRLQWTGHLFITDENCIPKKVFLQRMYGKRRRVNPKMRWVDAVGENLEAMD
ncbi:hypothetical protein C0J52_24288, partial [Blattella germanica]